MILKDGVVHLIRPGALTIERLVLHPLRRTYDGFILNAPTIASSPERVANFMREFKLPVPYVVDPKTYALARNPQYLRAKKRSWGRLLEHYGVEDRDLPVSPNMSDAALLEFTRRVCEYQRKGLPGPEQGVLQESSAELRPIALVAPYFCFSGTNDPWFGTNLKLLRAAIAAGGDLDVYGVLLLCKAVLSRPDELSEIAFSYAKLAAAGYLLWIDGMHEEKLGSDELRRLCRLIDILSGHGQRPVLNMFGGYLSAVLYHVGLTGFCHSVTGGEKRSVDPPSGHRQPVQYYLPPHHQMRPAHLVDDYLERIDILEPDEFTHWICGCSVCSRAVENGLDGFTAAFAAPVLDLQKLKTRVDFDSMVMASLHYLLARDREIRKVQDNSLEALVVALTSRAARYRDPASHKLFQTQHLKEWAKGLSEPLPE